MRADGAGQGAWGNGAASKCSRAQGSAAQGRAASSAGKSGARGGAHRICAFIHPLEGVVSMGDQSLEHVSHQAGV